MKLMSLNFEKISIEKEPKKLEELKVNTNIEFLEAKEVKSDFKIKGELLSVKFKYNVDYSSNFAKIEFIGNILFSLEQKESKTFLNEFKDKKISDEFKVPLFNFILRKVNVKSLQLEEELSIPLHIKLPYVEEKK